MFINSIVVSHVSLQVMAKRCLLMSDFSLYFQYSHLESGINITVAKSLVSHSHK
jgi:hypothetical protein